MSPPEGNKVDRVCDAIRAKLEVAGHNKYVQHLVFFLADLCSWYLLEQSRLGKGPRLQLL